MLTAGDFNETKSCFWKIWLSSGQQGTGSGSVTGSYIKKE